jgi:RNA-directed DNA polymerase
MRQDALCLRAVWTAEQRRMARWSPRSRRQLVAALPRLKRALRPALHRLCSHREGCGGVKGAVRRIQRSLPRARYVARFDIAAYYTSVRHDRMLGLLAEAGVAQRECARVRDYLALPDRRGTGRGLTASGSLSPLLGALYLAPLDHAMGARMRRGQLVSYVRYMDDFVLLARTRWQLRHAIAQLHEILRGLGLRVHRKEKVFIGAATKGFDFLGYQFHPRRKLRASRESLRRLRERARRLHEQGADTRRLREYVVRWWRWFMGGLDGMVSRTGGWHRVERRVLRWLDIHPGRGSVAAGGVCDAAVRAPSVRGGR